jgi:hypothetical protein
MAELIENKNININIDNIPSYEETDNIAVPKSLQPVQLYDSKGNKKGVDNSMEATLKAGKITTSVINKLHLIKLADNYPHLESDIPNNKSFFEPRTFVDLCQLSSRAMSYDPDDFLYCKNLGFPINRLITLRRFPYPCTDNLYNKEAQGEPDISRMVTYFSQDINKLDEILAFSYGLRWKELEAEFEQATMQGEQSGLSGFMKKVGKYIDPNLYNNTLRGDNANMLDPKFDQNKVYGPVDSITSTQIRNVGFDFTKEFELTFEYELKSWNGRTPEYAMKDILSNILACTYNNGKFWPGARYWIGERPSKFYQKYQYMNTDDMDNIISSGIRDIKSVIKEFSSKGSAVDTLKQAMRGGMALALGKILDKVGRPGILTMNSLLSGEPTGFWHLTIGNPINPIMCIGNLICNDVDFSFPSDSLSYGDFPTKMVCKIKLKPGQAKDRAGIEMMYNMGKHRIYYAPKTVSRIETTNTSRKVRNFFGFSDKEINNALGQAFDFISDGVKTVTTTVKDEVKKSKTSYASTSITVSSKNQNTLLANKEA